MRRRVTKLTLLALALACVGHAHAASGDLYGTTEPFASEAIYFVLTDRFVNGDTSNDQRDQGGDEHEHAADGLGPG